MYQNSTKMLSENSLPAAAPRQMYDFSFLRGLRKREGWTIGTVSDSSGISTPVISKLERNQTIAELETLYRLGRVFGLTASDLVALAESRIAQRKEAVAYRSENFRFQKISFANVSCFLAEADCGARVSRPEIHEDDYEICWVVGGRILLTLPHEHYELSRGMSVQFDAVQEHTYEALENSRVIILHLRKEKRF